MDRKLAQNEVFQILKKIILWNFSDFFRMKLQQYNSLKLIRMTYLGKILQWVQNEFFEFYNKSIHWIFLFCMKLR